MLGAGAAGTVYQAADPTGRKVAVKVLRAGAVATQTERERFRRERSALARIRHPNVLTVHSAGSWRGLPFVVTELLEGRTLRDEMEAPVPLERALQLVDQVAAGLEAMHAEGLVHRDVKPENVLLDESGVAKVADLGLVVGEDSEPRRATWSGRRSTWPRRGCGVSACATRASTCTRWA